MKHDTANVLQPKVLAGAGVVKDLFDLLLGETVVRDGV